MLQSDPFLQLACQQVSKGWGFRRPTIRVGCCGALRVLLRCRLFLGLSLPLPLPPDVCPLPLPLPMVRSAPIHEVD